VKGCRTAVFLPKKITPMKGEVLWMDMILRKIIKREVNGG
jgi:hypothetical protein